MADVSEAGQGSDKAPSGEAAQTAQVADQVLHLVREVIVELHPERAASLRVALDSTLDRDLGLDSLGRAELLLRLEKAFKIRLNEEVLSEAETPRALLTAVLQAEEGGGAQNLVRIERPALEPAEPAPLEAQTLTEMVDWHVAAHPDRTHVLLWDEPEGRNSMTYKELADSAQAVARGLLHWGLQPGDRAAIMLPSGTDFFEAFLGILYAGGVPVPIYPPVRLSQLEDHMRRQSAILENAEAKILITVKEARRVAAYLKSRCRSLKGIETVDRLHAFDAGKLPKPAHPENLAFLQYTSGSTGNPNGVMLTHANLLANVRAIGHAVNASPDDVFVSWLPLYHDLGLIALWLGSLYHAAPLSIMSPVTFLTRPDQWLWAIHKHRGSISAAPNFAFELCVRRIDDADIKGMDLSCLRMVLNGAEPIDPGTLTRFADKFSKFGYQPEAMTPGYGLAENSVGLCLSPMRRGPVIDRVDRNKFSTTGEVLKAVEDDENALEFVSLGQPLIGHEVRVVDGSSREVSERREGRIQFRGPSATQGFFHNEEKTRELFDNGWLNTGDLGYIAAGDLYITGRSKDIIIRAGRNIYPHEVEAAVGAIEGVRKGCVAMFGTKDSKTGTERIIILAETRLTDGEQRSALRRQVEALATGLLEAPPDEVVLVPVHAVPKTSSGKIRRNSAREFYENGTLGSGGGALWLQVLRMTAASSAARLRLGLRVSGEVIYATYWWTVLLTVAAAAWVVIAVSPRRSWRSALLRKAARAILWATGTPLKVSGLDNLPAGGCVMVSNHCSYLDAVTLVATLPGDVDFLAKKEFEGQFVAGTLLRRVGTIFVDRFDTETSLEDTNKAMEAARDGHRLMVFPEGTITRMPGLLTFRLGAFQVAAEAQVPVVPIILRGTRSILRDGQWFPRRGRIEMNISEPIEAEGGSDFAAAISLRDAARAVILEKCGEPDLSQERVIFSKSGIQNVSAGDS